MPYPISIDALRVLDAIARKGTFAAAADELHRVPSAVSYTIHKLEEDLNVQLFDRSGHRALLTPAGRYLLEQGRQLLEATDTLARSTQRVAQGWETRLRIALDSLLPIRVLFSAVQQFRELEVPVEIQLTEEVFAGSWDALHTGRADLIVGAALDAQPAGSYDTYTIGQTGFVYAVSPDHPLTRELEPVSEDQIRHWPAVVVADSSRQLPPGSAGIFARQSTLTVSGMHQKVQTQMAGLGVGWLPELHAAQALEAGELVALKVNKPRRPVDLCMARRKGEAGKAQNWFWEHLSTTNYFDEWLAPVQQ